MKVSILTLFPEMFQGPFEHSIIKRAKEKKKLTIEFVNIRQFGIGPHKLVDDKPYGGGAGMLMRVDVVVSAIEQTKCKTKCNELIIHLSPQGTPFVQKKARELSKYEHIILLCSHYEGADARVEQFIDEEVSIGDYILTGGELPAMVVADAVSRLLPGVLGKDESSKQESFEEGILEHPHYTRPEEFRGLKVPDILLSGNHKNIENFRKEESFHATRKKRPDLLKG